MRRFKNNNDYDVIVTRHMNVLKYLRSKGVKAKYVGGVARWQDIKGKNVIGTNLPLHLIDQTKSFTCITINYSGNSFDELPYDVFDDLGISARKYIVNHEDVRF